MNRDKMIKSAAMIDKIMRCLQKILVISGCLLPVGGMLFCLFGNTISTHSEYITDTVSFGTLSLTTPHGVALASAKRLSMGILTVGVMFEILIVIAWLEIRLFRRILFPIKNGLPFEKGISEILKKLAVFVLFAGTVQQLFTTIASGMIISAYDMEKLINTQIVTKYEIVHIFDFGFVAAAITLLLLSYIFRYGETLQQESDETL